MSIFSIFTLLRSKVVHYSLLIGPLVVLALQVRKGIQEDAVEEIILEQEKRDEDRAQTIRDRVANVPVSGLSTDPADDRGYRD